MPSHLVARQRLQAYRYQPNLQRMRLARAAGRQAGRVLKSAWKKWRSRKASSKKKKIRTRNKNEDDLIEISQHNDLSIHKLPNMAVPGAPLRAKGPKISTRFRHNQQAVVNALQGRQGLRELEFMMNREKIIGTVSGTANLNFLDAVSMWAMNTKTSRDSTILFPGPSPEVENTQSIFVKGCALTLESVNLASVPVHVEIYFLTPKYDTNDNPINAWNTVLNREGYTAPVVTGRANFASGVLVGKDAAENWGAKLFGNDGIGRVWTKMGYKHYVLQPGDQRNYKTYVRYNKYIKRSTFLDQRTHTYLKGLTVVPLVIVRGGVVGVTESPEASSVEVAHSACKVGFISTFNWSLGFPPNPSLPVTVAEDDLVTAFPVNQQKVVNDVDEPDDVELA